MKELKINYPYKQHLEQFQILPHNNTAHVPVLKAQKHTSEWVL